MVSQLVVGHRGYPLLYPENTLLSYREAVNAGAKAIEVDVRKTSDGNLVIMHDSTVNRTTNGTGSVSALTLSYIKSLDAGAWKGSEFAGRSDTKVPTLHEVLDEFKDKPVIIFLHIADNTTATGLEVLKVVKQVGMLNQCLFFQADTVIREIKIREKKAITVTGGMPNESTYEYYLNQAITYKHDIVSVNANEVTANMVNDIKSHGFPIFASYVNSNYADVTQNLLNLGIKMILTDDVATSVSVFESNGIEQDTPNFNLPECTFIAKIDGEIKVLDAYINQNGNITKVVCVF